MREDQPHAPPPKKNTFKLLACKIYKWFSTQINLTFLRWIYGADEKM